MAIKYESPVANELSLVKARKLLESIQGRLKNDTNKMPAELVSELYQAFEKLFTGIAEPMSRGFSLSPKDIRSYDEFFEYLSLIKADLDILFASSHNLTDAALKTFNLAVAKKKQVDYAVAKAQSLSADLQLLDDDLSSQVVVAGDDFSTKDNLDFSTVEGSRCEVLPGGLGLTIERAGSSNVIDLTKAKVYIASDTNTYEGKYYAPLGKAEPEGNAFHWKSILASEIDTAFQSTKEPGRSSSPVNTASAQITMGAGAVVAAGTALATAGAVAGTAAAAAASAGGLGAGLASAAVSASVVPVAGWIAAGVLATGAYLTGVAGRSQARARRNRQARATLREFRSRIADSVPPSINEVVFYDEGPPEDGIMANRLLMLDGNPDSYWQIELTSYSEELALWQKQKEDEAAEAQEAGLLPTPVSVSDLQQQISSLSLSNLDAAIVIDLGEEVPVTWLSLLPMNFYSGAWLEMLNVETAGTDQKFEQVPDLDRSLNERFLTPEANEDLQPSEVAGVLTDTKNFAGQGLWIFPARTIRYVRFILRQAQAIPCPYSVLVVDAEQDVTVTTRTSKVKKSWGVTKRSHSENVDEDTYVAQIEFDYTRSVILNAGTYDFETLVTGEEAAEDDSVSATTGGRKLAQSTKKNTTIEVEYQDWHMANKTEVPKYDITRRAIGIRDIAINRFTFMEESTFVSVPFKAPGTIRKVALLANELIPEELQNMQSDVPWIQYFISFDGSDWTEIRPQSSIAMHNRDNVATPQIVNVNSILPKEEQNIVEGYVSAVSDASIVRLKAVFRRPAGEDNSTMAPVLRNYRLKLYCRSL